jgi:hypothetical protein
MSPAEITVTATRIAAFHANSPSTPGGYARLAADLGATTGCLVACGPGTGHDVRVRFLVPGVEAFDLLLPERAVAPATASRHCFYFGGYDVSLTPGDPCHLPELICDHCGSPRGESA